MRMKRVVRTAAVVAAMMVGAVQAQASQIFDFSYSGTNVWGSGVLTTTDAGSPFSILGISGTANGEAITGLSGYASADNLIYFPTQPFVDFSGMAFNTATKAWSIGWTGSDYGIINSIDDPSGACCGTHPITFTVTPGGVPEPATWTLAIIGFGLAGAALRRRSQPAQA